MTNKRYGHVYILENNRSGLIKIGYTKDVEARLKHLSSVAATDGRFYNTCCVEDARTLERDMHKALTDVSVGGEWFTYSFDQAVTLLKGKAVLHPEITDEHLQRLKKASRAFGGRSPDEILAALDNHFSPRFTPSHH